MRKRIGLPEAPHLKTKVKELDGAVAKEEVEELPEDLFIKPINLTESKMQNEKKKSILKPFFSSYDY